MPPRHSCRSALPRAVSTGYRPRFRPTFACNVETQGSYTRTACRCKTGKIMGMVMTDTGNEAYSLSLFGGSKTK